MGPLRSLFLAPLGMFFFVLIWTLLNLVLPQNIIYLNVFSKALFVFTFIGLMSSVEAYYYWGSPVSYLGKSFFMFSLGMLFTFLGQVCYTFAYIEEMSINPYPNYIELFFLLALTCYLFGAYFLGTSTEYYFPKQKVSMVYLVVLSICLTSACLLLLATLVSRVMPLELLLLLELLYPLGQIVVICVIVCFAFFSKSLLSKEMLPGMLLLIVAFIVNYSADLFFSFLSYSNLWRPGDLSDLLYGLSYMLIGYSMAVLSRTYYRSHKFNLLIVEKPE